MVSYSENFFKIISFLVARLYAVEKVNSKHTYFIQIAFP